MTELWLFLGASSLWVLALSQIWQRLSESGERDAFSRLLKRIGAVQSDMAETYRKYVADVDGWRVQHDQQHFQLMQSVEDHLGRHRKSLS